VNLSTKTFNKMCVPQIKIMLVFFKEFSASLFQPDKKSCVFSFTPVGSKRLHAEAYNLATGNIDFKVTSRDVQRKETALGIITSVISLSQR